MSYYEVKVFYGGPMKDHCEKFICGSVKVDDSGDGIFVLKDDYSQNDYTTVVNGSVLISPYHYAKVTINEIEDHIMDRMRLDKRVDNSMRTAPI